MKERMPFSYTRDNVLKAYGKEIGMEKLDYVWDLLDRKASFEDRVEENAMVDQSEIDRSKGSVYLGKNVEVKDSEIRGPAWVGENTKLGPNALLRSGSIGKGCKIGHGVEIKNSIIMDDTNVPHLSYVGDSIIGSNVNLAAGTVLSNLRHDGKDVKVEINGKGIETGRRKLGALIGDCVKTGINTSVYEGGVLGPFSFTAPSSKVKYNLKPFSKKCDGEIQRVGKEEALSIFPDYREKIEELWDELCAE